MILREIVTLVILAIAVALLVGAAVTLMTLPCDPMVQKCLDK